MSSTASVGAPAPAAVAVGSETPDQTRERVRVRVQDALDRLCELWGEIGFAAAARGQRCAVLSRHIADLLAQMVHEEEALVRRMHDTVASYGGQLDRLTTELHLPSESFPSECLLERERLLRSRVDELGRERTERFARLARLKERDQTLADQLYATPHYVAGGGAGAVPTVEALDTLGKHVESLEAEKEGRLKVFRSLKCDVIQFYESVERTPDTSFSRDVVRETESAMLTPDKMADLRDLHAKLDAEQKMNFAQASDLREKLTYMWTVCASTEGHAEEHGAEHAEQAAAFQGFKPSVIRLMLDELERCEKLRLENLGHIMSNALTLLRAAWRRCYTSEDDQHLFIADIGNDVSEEKLDVIEMEVKRMKTYEKENDAMLKLVLRRQVLWEQFIECEHKASDPHRFYQRGGNLLKEEKARNKIMKELPKVERQVNGEIEAWELANGREFYVRGARFTDYIRAQWDDYHRQKDSEKHERQQARAKKNMQEVLFGSKPTTPAKRHFLSTISHTPTKRRECTTDAPHTPGSAVKRVRGGAAGGAAGGAHHDAAPALGLYVSHQVSHLHKTKVAPGGSVWRSPRRALVEKNVLQSTQCVTATSSGGSAGSTTGTTSTLFSSAAAAPHVAIAALEPYQDFAQGLSSAARPNCRSSIMPPAPVI